MFTSLTPLQQALYTALLADATYTALCPAVYDAVPQTPTFPHTVIGEALELSDRTMGQNGFSVMMLCSIYTRDGSTTRAGTGTRGSRMGLLIAQQQVERLVEQDVLVVGGFALPFIEVESVETFREPDGITRRTDVRYRLMVEAYPVYRLGTQDSNSLTTQDDQVLSLVDPGGAV